jgi:ribonuclease BN (tRNA processing enzyme)
VFSGDTAYFPDLAGFAQGADLLVHEAMLEAAIEALLTRVGNGDERLRAHFYAAHSTAAEAAKIAVAANVKALALNHLIPSDDPDFGEAEWLAAIRPIWDGPFYLGHDGLRIAF